MATAVMGAPVGDDADFKHHLDYIHFRGFR
jgi:hypothetical protein